MKKVFSILLMVLLAADVCGAALVVGGDIGQTTKQETSIAAIILSVLFVVGTLWITKWAAKHTRSVVDFYTAGGDTISFQSDLAISGNYVSAVSFLGISAAAMTSDYDGLIYSIGFLVGWPIITFLMTERLRNPGKFTFTDVVGHRLERGPTRSFVVVSMLVMVAFYLTIQIVGTDQLIKLLFELDYWIAVVTVGALMMVYVPLGGMTTTTWAQIIKTCMLLAGVTFMAIMMLARYDFNLEALFTKVVQVKTAIAANTGKPPDEAARVGLPVMAPGGFIKGSISAISFGMALMLDTTGLSHTLMHPFTVSDVKETHKSVFWITIWIGHFYILIFIVGLGAVILVLTNPELSDVAESVIKGGMNTANMATVLVIRTVGGDVFYGFISVVTFAMILTVVAGPMLSGASVVSHDFYATAFKHGKANSADELEASCITTLTLDVIVVLLGIAFKRQNIVFMVSLAFAVAVSAGFSMLFLLMLWKGCTTRDAAISGFLGLISSVGLTIVSPSVWEVTPGYPKGSAQFSYTSPALLSMTIGFVGTRLFSVSNSSVRAKNEKVPFAA